MTEWHHKDSVEIVVALRDWRTAYALMNLISPSAIQFFFVITIKAVSILCLGLTSPAAIVVKT